MSNYCVSEHGGWAGYHAAAIRVSGVSLSSFVCYDWDMTSSCRTDAITAANRDDEKSPY